MREKIRKVAGFAGHPLFPMGAAGVSQSTLYALCWNFAAASGVRSGGGDGLGGLMLASIVAGGLSFVVGGAAMGRQGICASRMAALAMVVQAAAALAMALRVPFPYSWAAALLFGVTTGFFYAGRSAAEVSRLDGADRDRWLAAVGTMGQTAGIALPFAAAALAPLDPSESKIALACAALCAGHLWLARRLWKSPHATRSEPMKLSGAWTGLKELFEPGGPWLFFTLESAFWAARLFAFPMAAGLFAKSLSAQGMLEGGAALASAIAGAALVRKWSPKSRFGFLAFSIAPIAASWGAVAAFGGALSFAALALSKALFQPFVDTGMRAAVLDGVKREPGSDGLEGLCGRELLLIVGRGATLGACAWSAAEFGVEGALRFSAGLACLFGMACLLAARSRGKSAVGIEPQDKAVG